MVSLDPAPRAELNEIRDEIVRQPSETVRWLKTGTLIRFHDVLIPTLKCAPFRHNGRKCYRV